MTQRNRTPRTETTVEITVERGLPTIGSRELWQARGVLGFLVWRDVKVRYAQTVLGIAWVVLQPLLTAFVFTLLFGKLAKLPSDGVPYAPFALVGLILWTFFSSAVAGAGNSMIEQSSLLTKVYFPRLFVPFSSVAVSVLDMSVALLIVMPTLMILAPPPRMLSLLLLPVFLLIAVASSMGAGAAFAALNLRYRDFRYVIPFLLQMWMFGSPIAYPMSMVPTSYHVVYALNPVVSAVEGCRWALLGTAAPTPGVLIASSSSAICMFIVGMLYFRWSERTLVDVA